MNTKLTLTIEESVVEKAKKYAKKSDRSLSDLIENYLIAITDNKESLKTKSAVVRSLKGTFTAPTDFDYKKELTKSLSEKYLR